jgi:hypothetical protein
MKRSRHLKSRLATAVVTAAAAAVCLLALPKLLAAHEHRAVGPKGEYSMTVGWFHEPAFKDSVNAVDIYINRTADDKPINTDKGDVVDLEIEVQLRSSEDASSKVLYSTTLDHKATLTMGTENRYDVWFLPVREGSYAFRIRGRIADASKPVAGPVTIDETFVCGKGSKGHHDAFHCIVQPQVFPRDKK